MNKKKNTLVSIIMAEYNTDKRLLKESIESIIKQSYSDFELIIIDDCGKNDVDLIVSDIDDNRIKVYKNDKNRGLVYSLNRAISLSKGKYIARMDTDDYSYSNRIQEIINFMNSNPKYDIVASRCDYYDENGIWGESKGCGVVTKDKLLAGCPMTHPTVAFRKKAINKIGGYRNFKRCEDYATWIEAYLNGCKMYVMDKKLIKYHLSKEDYKKRKLSTRGDLFRLIDEQFPKLGATKMSIILYKTKTLIAGLIPTMLIYNYHRKIYGKNNS